MNTDYKYSFITSSAFAQILRIEYAFCRRLLNRLADEKIIRRVEKRFNVNEVLTYFYLGNGPPPIQETMKEGVLLSQEVFERIFQEYAPMHLKTVQRKIRSGQIPSYKIDSIYRIPTSSLKLCIEEASIPYHPKKN